MAPLSEGFDVAIGSRYVKGGSIPNWAWHRHLLSRGGNLYASGVLGLGVADSTAGYRAYSAGILRRLDLERIRAEGYGFQIEMTYRARQLGADITEVPIKFVDREAGESKMSSFIVIEALGLVTWWGLGRVVRGTQRIVRGLAGQGRVGPCSGRYDGDGRPNGGRVRHPWPRPPTPRTLSGRHESEGTGMTVEAPPARILVVDDEPNIAELSRPPSPSRATRSASPPPGPRRSSRCAASGRISSCST